MVDRLRLSRAQIAAFVGNDPEAIRQIEKLFSTAVSQETGIDEVAVIAGTADSKAGQALSELQRIADTLEAIASAPVPVLPNEPDDLTPVVQQHSVRKAYGWFYDTTDQTAAVANTAYAMTFNNSGETQDVRIGTPTSRIYVDRQGIYNIQFSAQLLNTAGGAHRAWIWLRINGTDVPDSATVMRLEGNNTELVAAWNFVSRLDPGDYFELMWEVSDTALSLFADAATAVHPAIPSVLLSVTDNISE